jgi:hypothetical protein
MRRAILVLLFIFAIPANAHHTREHVLGAPSPPPAVVTPVAPDASGGSRILWALGPFFALAAIGMLRWGYRRHRDNKNKDSPD